MRQIMENEIEIRQAVPADTELLLSLIDALADYEKVPRPDAAAKQRLVRDGFGATPRFQAYFAEQDGRTLGYALTIETYSSFVARPTLYLEDIFVLPEERRRGVGRAFFRFLAAEALRRGCARMEWAVLTWNQSAIDFYESAGAQRINHWYVYRLTDDQLRPLAGEPVTTLG
jgi:GNAT superfamily N-acetyltransferase